ncbi:hypothetical protein ACP70R_043117 [Stipagrostis hirtigluma subsp. patula]
MSAFMSTPMKYAECKFFAWEDDYQRVTARRGVPPNLANPRLAVPEGNMSSEELLITLKKIVILMAVCVVLQTVTVLMLAMKG